MADNFPEPLIKTALGDAWQNLAEPIRRHYGLHCGMDEHITLQGQMRVDYPRRVLPLILAARVCGALVHRRGENVEVTVRNHTQSGSAALFWHRSFRFPKHPVIFTSHMEHLAKDEIIEFVGFGLGLRLRLSERDGALVFRSCGYLWRIGPLRLYLPDWLLLGQAEIIERAENQDTLVLDFQVTHPWWGRTYDYGGRFML